MEKYHKKNLTVAKKKKGVTKSTKNQSNKTGAELDR
jgi:hypothetical protein